MEITKTSLDASKFEPFELTQSEVAYLDTDADWVVARRRLNPEVIPFLRAEGSKGWVLSPDSEPLPTLTGDKDFLRSIGNGETVCPLCQGYELTSRLMVGINTGIRTFQSVPCACRRYKLFVPRWYATVPENYRDCNSKSLCDEEFLKTRFKHMGLSRDHKRIGDQIRFFKKILSDHESASVLISGAAGCGKTSFMYAEYHTALWKWADAAAKMIIPVEAVWLLSAPDWAKSNTEYQWAEEKKNEDGTGVGMEPPLINETKVRKAIASGQKPHIFSDEFDKRKVSPFQNTIFHTIINLVYESGGRIMVLSNMDGKGLQSLFGPTYGEAIMRRIVGDPAGIYMSFDNGLVKLCDYLQEERIRNARAKGPVIEVSTDAPLTTKPTDTPIKEAPPQPPQVHVQVDVPTPSGQRLGAVESNFAPRHRPLQPEGTHTKVTIP